LHSKKKIPQKKGSFAHMAVGTRIVRQSLFNKINKDITLPYESDKTKLYIKIVETTL